MKKQHYVYSLVEVVGKRNGQSTIEDSTVQDIVSIGEDVIARIPKVLLENGWTEIMKFTVKEVKVMSNCYGCRNDKCDQMSHMQPDGCLNGSIPNSSSL